MLKWITLRIVKIKAPQGASYFRRVLVWKNVNAAAASHLVSANVAANKGGVLDSTG